jgi:hypothetical protein
MNIRTWLGQQISKEQAVMSNPLVVTQRHNVEYLNSLTKKQVVAYAKEYNIQINSRKKREELIEIILRS